MAIGERTPLASVDAPASGRMAIGECLTNLAAANIRDLSEIKLSANWMAAAGHNGDDAALYETVKAVGMELCPELGIAIPVGKDSMSMKTVWQDEQGESRSVTAPVSCVISAFAPVGDVDLTLTPELTLEHDTSLILLDLSGGKRRLACSILAQVYNQVGTQTPDIDDSTILKNGFLAIQKLLSKGLLCAYHDRSDGGLITAAIEMAFASRCGLELDINIDGDALSVLFNEELGMLFQVADSDLPELKSILAGFGLTQHLSVIGKPLKGERIAVSVNGNEVLDASRVALHRAILREQGVNGHIEMGAAFTQAGFSAIDVTMTDIKEQRVDLADFKGLVACGGFSYGDVLGAGEGWAKSILFNTQVRDAFQAYFERQDAFSLGVCNGCQMMSNLKEIIPGASAWPHFVRNASEQFEARLVQTEISKDSNSILLAGMQGSKLPVVVAHGEGRAEYQAGAPQGNLALSYIDYQGKTTESYPANPNGSPNGIAGLSNDDGRVMILMPHPERIFRSSTNSWRDQSWGEYGPWMRMFRNARLWVD